MPDWTEEIKFDLGLMTEIHSENFKSVAVLTAA
jgi:hypothetical protein